MSKPDKKDKEVLRIAQRYVEDLRDTKQPDLWRDFWKREGDALAQRKGK
jgi:hypothetical protein